MPYTLTATGFQRAPYGKTDANMQAAGGVVSTAADLGRWLHAQLNHGRVDGVQILPAEAVRTAQDIQAPVDANVRGMPQVGYSLGWQVLLHGTDTLYSHGGGFTGFAARIAFLPAHQVGVAVLANASSVGGVLADAVTSEILAHFAGPAPFAGDAATPESVAARARRGFAADQARRAARSQQLPYALSAYVGVFENVAYGRLELRRHGGRLEAVAGAARSAVEVLDAARNQLRVELTGSGSAITVEMRNGRAASLVWMAARFTRT